MGCRGFSHSVGFPRYTLCHDIAHCFLDFDLVHTSKIRLWPNKLGDLFLSRTTRTILTTKSIPERTSTTPTTKIVVECTHATPIVAECSWWNIEQTLCRPLPQVVPSNRRTYGLLTPEPPTIWHLIKSGFSNYESRSVMSKPEMTPHTRFDTSAMSRSAKEVSKHSLKMSCMFPPSQRIWSRSACMFDSTKKGASSKKKAKSSCAEEERADVHPRLTRDEICHVREKHKSRFRHRAMAQANLPH